MGFRNCVFYSETVYVCFMCCKLLCDVNCRCSVLMYVHPLTCLPPFLEYTVIVEVKYRNDFDYFSGQRIIMDIDHIPWNLIATYLGFRFE